MLMLCNIDPVKELIEINDIIIYVQSFLKDIKRLSEDQECDFILVREFLSKISKSIKPMFTEE